MSRCVSKKPARSPRNRQVIFERSDSIRCRFTRFGKKIENHGFDEIGSGW